MALMAAGIIGGAGLISGGLGYYGSTEASQLQAAQAAQALNWQKQVYAQTMQNEMPFIKTGQGADYTLAQLYGLPGGAGGAAGRPNYSSFYNSPDYLWALQQGNNAITNQLAAKGNLISGGGMTAIAQYNQGLASQQYTNYVQRLMDMARMGSGAAAAAGNTGANMANTIGGQYNTLGTAQAGGVMGGMNALAGGFNTLGNAGGMYGYLMRNQGTPNPSGYQPMSPQYANVNTPWPGMNVR